MNGKLRMSVLLSSLLAAGLGTQGTAFAGRTLYVDPQAAGANDGTSWGDAYVHLDDAINAAEPGDEILEVGDRADPPDEPLPAEVLSQVAGMYWTDRGVDAILKANLDGTSIAEVLTGLDIVHGIAFDLSEGKMYYAEVGPGPGFTGTIRRSNLDGTDIETLVTNLHVPRGIALDLVHGKMYWSDLGGGTKRIERANLDGSEREYLVLAEAYNLALDVIGGKMYWPNISNTTGRKIQRANLDGTDVEDLVTTGVYGPSGIALDMSDGKMYWTDQGTHKIQRANLDGTIVQDVVTTGLDRPFGIALHLEAGRMYWVDWGELPNIRRAGLDGSNVEDLITTGLDWPLYIDILLCTDDTDCDDGNPCTYAVCDEAGECQREFTTNECRPSAGPCDVEEFCTGEDAACPPDLGVPDGTPCPDDGNECTEDVCSLKLCVHPAEAAGTACGDPAGTPCDDPDSCDSFGNCQVNWAADGMPCPDDGNECTEDVCSSSLCVHPAEPAGTACGDPAGTPCDDPDSCDSFGNCQVNWASDGTPCPDDGSECTEDVCSSGLCMHPLEPAGSACGDTSETACDDPDSCDSFGNCQVNWAADGTPCPDGEFCNGDEACADGICSAGTPPCPPDLFCDELLDRCTNTPVIPTGSGWGLAILALLLLTGAKAYFGRGSPRSTGVTPSAE